MPSWQLLSGSGHWPEKKDIPNKHKIIEVYEGVITGEGLTEKSKSMSKGEGNGGYGEV